MITSAAATVKKKKNKKPCSKTVWKSTASHVSLPDTNT